MMIPFDKLQHMDELRAMYASWGAPNSCPTPESLPAVGFIEPHLAAMFLINPDTDYAILEHAITHRRAPGHTESIHRLVETLMGVAKVLGKKKVYVNVGNEHAVARAVATGFKLDTEPQRWQLSREVQ